MKCGQTSLSTVQSAANAPVRADAIVCVTLAAATVFIFCARAFFAYCSTLPDRYDGDVDNRAVMLMRAGAGGRAGGDVGGGPGGDQSVPVLLTLISATW